MADVPETSPRPEAKKESTLLLVTPDAFAKDEKTRHMLVYSGFKVVEQKLVVLKPADVLRLLKLGSLLPAVKLAIRSLTSPDFFGSRSSLDGLLRRPTTGLPCMLSAARGVLDTVGTRSSMATLPVPAREATDAEKNLWGPSCENPQQTDKQHRGVLINVVRFSQIR